MVLRIMILNYNSFQFEVEVFLYFYHIGNEKMDIPSNN